MVRMDTIDKICKFLDITPGDFFEFSPIDFEFSIQTTNFKIDYDFYSSVITGVTFDFDFFMDVIPRQKRDIKTFSFEGKSKLANNGILEVNVELENLNEIKDIGIIIDGLSPGLKSQYFGMVRYQIMHEFSQQMKDYQIPFPFPFQVSFEFHSQSAIFPYEITDEFNFDME